MGDTDFGKLKSLLVSTVKFKLNGKLQFKNDLHIASKNKNKFVFKYFLQHLLLILKDTT